MECDEDKKLTMLDRVCVAALVAWPFVFTILLTMATAGCAYKGAKVVEGTNLSVGINFPAAEGEAQLQVLNYLSGFRLGVDRNAILRVKYTTAENNTYFGVISTGTARTVDAEVEPCETQEAAEK